MKIRTSFVSNSSSASYIIDLEAYESVHHLAKAMLELVMEDYKMNYPDVPIKYAEDCLVNLKEALASGLDPNTPVHFPTINFDTEIARTDKGYHVDTCMNHPFWDLNGVLQAEEYLPNFPDVDLYLAEFDVLGRLKQFDPDIKCENENHFQMIVLKSGEIICPQCNPEKIEQHKVVKK